MKTFARTARIGIWAMAILAAAAASISASENGVLEKIKQANTPFTANDDFRAALSLPDHVVRVHSTAPAGDFYTETRQDKIERYSCSHCHKPDSPEAEQIARAAIAHGDIKLVHGGREKPLSCFTCHSEEKRDLLITESGATVDMDHSYQLCAQCHFRQKKDWVGGAHGKRVGAWAGQRVVKNCTACHNPHSPRFAKRWPKTYSPPNQR